MIFFATVRENEGESYTNAYIYDVTDKIGGTKVVDDTSTKKFSNLANEIKIADNKRSCRQNNAEQKKPCGCPKPNLYPRFHFASAFLRCTAS